MNTCLNIGCGCAPTYGYKNYDNSWSIRLARKRWGIFFLDKLGFLCEENRKAIEFAKKAKIYYADVKKKIPEANNSVSILYSSHMLEHLNKEDAYKFIKEAYRVLQHGGIIRLAVPDIKYHIDNYLQHQDADLFIKNTGLIRKQPKKLVEKIKYLLIGDRHHQWMYDGLSLCKLLKECGFSEAEVMCKGKTKILAPGKLDLEERSPESVFVEAVKKI